jgi:predicted dehydrogenase
MMGTGLTRRQFVAGSLAAGATLMGTRGKVLGANNDIRMAIVGVRGKGNGHINAFRRISGVRIVALCDVDTDVLASRASNLDNVDTYVDMREMLERKDIDAVCLATPNHLHSLQSIWACQAGKDVYVEKPMSHNIWEGRKVIEAAKKYNRVVQHGTQSRSGRGIQEAIEYIRSGKLGKVRLARGTCYKRRESIGKVSGPQQPPASVDYNLWAGPAPLDPIMRERFHYDWHWIWATGNGDIGNQGVHEMDMCYWALGDGELPTRVVSYGGRFGYVDDGETPNTQIALMEFRNSAPLMFEVRGLPRAASETASDDYRGARVGIVIHCENGYFSGGGGGGWIFDNDGKRIQQFTGDGRAEHQANFIKAVRSRKAEDNFANVDLAHRSSVLCHLGNVSYQLGQDAPAHVLVNRVYNNEALSEAFGRMATHIASNGVNLAETPITAGPALEFDPATERFTNNDAANALLTRQYREPFVVPENV